MRLPSGEWASPRVSTSWAGTESIRWPSNHTSPDSGRSSPEIVLSVVVLPAPLVPTRVTTWPCSTVKEMPFTARTRP